MDKVSIGNQISKYYKSFSGTDTLAFILMPGSSPVVIGSLTTISYSMFRNKKPVINIGRTNINGVTRGSRIFAGTMIFTLINQHWLRELQEQLDWLKGFEELKVDELPLFDIMIVSANEYGNCATMYIYGIDFTDEAQTISVEDLFTENTFSFIARDVSPFRAGDIKMSPSHKSSNGNKYDEFSQKLYVLDSSPITLDDLYNLEEEFAKAKMEYSKPNPKWYTLSRELYYSSSKTMMGNDVAEIQELLNRTGLFELTINGVFDNAMDEAIRRYQSLIGDDQIDGIVDNMLYNRLINQTVTNDIQVGVVVNKYGAYVYREKSVHSDIVDTKQYREQINLYEIDSSNEDGYFQKWYRTDTGYVTEEDIYSSYYTGSIIEFPQIQYGDFGSYVTLVQSALATIYPEFTQITGEYDELTEAQVKTLQESYGIRVSGIIDNDTWLLLQSLSGNISTQVSDDNFNIEFTTVPDTYQLSSSNILNEMNLFKTTISCDNPINVKVTATATYDESTSEVSTQTLIIQDSQEISLETFKNSFNYNPKYGKIPKQVDYVIYPYNKKPYKWTIMYS